MKPSATFDKSGVCELLQGLQPAAGGKQESLTAGSGWMLESIEGKIKTRQQHSNMEKNLQSTLTSDERQFIISSEAYRIFKG